MLITHSYRRDRAVRYAKTWALSRNPLFFSFAGIGGDCTSFVSQCVYAGSCTMNYEDIFGWYYVNQNDRTASWSGVNFFYNFMTKNRGIGPFGIEISENMLMEGDIIQLGMENGTYYHAMLVTGFEEGVPLVCAHSNDSLDRRLDTYTFDKMRCIRIVGVRTDSLEPNENDCFPEFITGQEL